MKFYTKQCKISSIYMVVTFLENLLGEIVEKYLFLYAVSSLCRYVWRGQRQICYEARLKFQGSSCDKALYLM